MVTDAEFLALNTSVKKMAFAVKELLDICRTQEREITDLKDQQDFLQKQLRMLISSHGL